MVVRRIALISVLFFASSFLNPVLADDMNADEEAVWALEEAYWDYATNNDIKGYLTLWDEDFVGWPGFSPIPAAKQNIADWIVRHHKDPAVRHYFEITPMAVRSFGDIVAVHYIADAFRVDIASGHSEKIWINRITHTWKRTGNSWQIITGMSIDLPFDD